jgi:hypothetical protein
MATQRQATVQATVVVACFLSAALAVFFVRLLGKNGVKQRLEGVLPQGVLPQGLLPQGLLPQGVTPQGLPPQGVPPQGFSVVPSPPDGRCLYHSLLTGLLRQKEEDSGSNTDELMGKIRDVYVQTVKNPGRNSLFHALRADFVREIKKIDALRARRPLGADGFPDVGAIQVLVHQGSFPYRVNLGVVDQTGQLEITRFPSASAPTIFVRQVGGDNGHFDALVVDGEIKNKNKNLLI